LSNEHKRHFLDAPWTGLWNVLRRGPKTYPIDWKGKGYTVSVDRLQPAYVLADFAEHKQRKTISTQLCSFMSSLSACPASSAPIAGITNLLEAESYFLRAD